jgi:D-glycero-D-manno-heptose 1,7-bisphosphate phosphatase
MSNNIGTQFLLPSGDYFRVFAVPPMRTACLFLDRDGVIIEDRSFVSRPEDVQLCPYIHELFSLAARRNIAIVLVTNQSGIGRGYYDWPAFEAVQARMMSLLNDRLGQTASLINAVVACPHHPTEGTNGFRADPLGFRKPLPGMIDFALDRLGLARERSVMIGDRDTDVVAGIKARMRRSIQLLNGFDSLRIASDVGETRFHRSHAESVPMFLSRHVFAD